LPTLISAVPAGRRASSAELHTFPNAVTLRTPGKWVLTVTDTALPQVTGSATVTVWPALRGVPPSTPPMAGRLR
jgi:hypothetical protein